MFGAITTNSLRLYNIEQEEPRLQVPFTESELGKMAWGGDILALGSLDGTIHVLDLSSDLNQ